MTASIETTSPSIPVARRGATGDRFLGFRALARKDLSAWRHGIRPWVILIVSTGFMTLAAYLLILVALSVAPLSGVAPLRESATVFAAAWGSVALGEAADRGDAARRILASVAIVAGALCLAVGL